MALFEITVADGGDRVVRLQVAGAVDMSTAPQLLDAVACTAEAHDRHNIVVDLQGVSFIDSVGLNALIRADRCVRSFRRPSDRLQPVEAGPTTVGGDWRR